MKNSAIVVMAKEPIPGQVKTRLCPPLSHEQAAALYEASCRDVVENALEITSSQTVIAATPARSVGFFQSLAPSALVLPIEADTIGGCLFDVTTQLLHRGYKRVLAVSSDSPDLWPGIMQSALERLDDCDLVLGPALDGGYYLIGLKKAQPALFTNDISWSTETVLQQTTTIAEQTGLSYALLPSRVTDLDRIDDLPQLIHSLDSAPPTAARWTRQFLASSKIEPGRSR